MREFNAKKRESYEKERSEKTRFFFGPFMIRSVALLEPRHKTGQRHIIESIETIILYEQKEMNVLRPLLPGAFQ